MNQLTGTWIAPEFLNGNTDSGKFIKFLDDSTYVINDGMDQAESVYKVEGSNLTLEPALGLSSSSLPYKFNIEKKNKDQILTLLIENKGITYSFVRKSE